VTFTKTTTRAFAASLAMVAAGGTIAGAAVFHLPILGLGRADVASADATSTAPKRVVHAVPKKAHRKVVVKTRYADVIVHVPAPSSGGSGGAAAIPAPSAAPTLQPASSEPVDSVPEVTEPEETTTTSVSTPSTVGEHDDEGEHEDDGEPADAPDVSEHDDASSAVVGQP
jgi:hypothetical protein